MCAPLVCQSIIATGIAWNHFYFGSLVLSGISAALAFVAFRPTTAEMERDISHAQNEARSKNSSAATLTQEKDLKDRAESPISEENVGLPELKGAPPPSKSER